MRLSPTEIEHIVRGVSECIEKQHAELRLFGSRVNPQAKGGDIDLLLVVENEKTRKEFRNIKHRILAEIKKNLGERKIDITIVTRDHSESDAFLSSIIPTSIVLHRW